jgi:hypothetical protein
MRFGSSPILSCQQVVSLSQSYSESPVELTDGRGGRGWGRSQTIRRRESLVLYNSFITLCSGVSDQISLRSYLPCSAGASFLSTSYTRRITSVIYNLKPTRSVWKSCDKVFLSSNSLNLKVHKHERVFLLLKGPKLEIFGSGVFAQIRPIWVGDLGTRPKNPTMGCLCLKIANLYFLALKATTLKIF